MLMKQWSPRKMSPGKNTLKLPQRISWKHQAQCSVIIKQSAFGKGNKRWFHLHVCPPSFPKVLRYRKGKQGQFK